MATEYLVLGREVGGSWQEFGRVTATSATQAQRKTAEAEEGGTYVAVPSRSFNPVTFTVEKISRVKVVEGGGS